MVRLGDLELGPLPRLAATVSDRELGDTGWAALVDVIEVRLDQLSSPSAERAAAVCTALRALGKPLVATVRWSAEGGATGLDDSERRALYARVAPCVDGLDIELRSPLCDEIVSLARKHGRLAIVSHHDFRGTPAAAALQSLLAEGRRGDVVKVATTAAEPTALRRLLDLLLLPDDRPRIVIGMGEVGAASRVFFPLLGSVLTYGFVGAPMAPGQLSLAELYDALRRYSPSFATTHPPRG
jgi:3-dehydroquinate dehydratase-1